MPRACSTADRLDWALMVIGALGAAGNGATWPIFAVLFSKFADAFGGSSPNFMNQVRAGGGGGAGGRGGQQWSCQGWL